METPRVPTSAFVSALKPATIWRSVPLPAVVVAPTTELPAAEAHVAVDAVLERAQAALLGRQHADGHWAGRMRGASATEAQYILVKCFLGQERDPHLPKIANALRGMQEADGGWGLFPGGAADLSATVKAYFALKLLGEDPHSEHMRRARLVCLSLGGVGMCDALTKYYLAALGQISYDQCPAIPAELMLLPRWLYFNVYAVSAPVRTTLIPLAIISAMRPVRQVGPERSIRELFESVGPEAAGPVILPATWYECFALVETWVQRHEKLPVAALRRKGLRAAEEWVLEHLEDQQGTVVAPICYALIALRALGYRENDPKVAHAHARLQDLFIEETQSIRIQPGCTPARDTGLALYALAEAGIHHATPAAQAAGSWLLARECSRAVDWVEVCPEVDPAGWFFEFANPYYPDADATATAAMALRRCGDKPAQAAAFRGVDWLLAIQNDDGGWAAFKRTRHTAVHGHAPFVNAHALHDPSYPDITGRVLECLGHCGTTVDNPAVARAIDFLQAQQDDDGCWQGRGGVNYLYGTWQVLTGLQGVGTNMDEFWVRRSAQWLRHRQHGDGSWGESCQSFDDPTLKGQGAPTASQTAWGVMALMTIAGPEDPAVRRGMRWLITNQQADGAWRDDTCTATGYPRLCYHHSDLYPLYYPLLALARYRRLTTRPATGD